MAMSFKEKADMLATAIDDFQKDGNSLLSCLRTASGALMAHTQFQHYTSFTRALQILKHRRIWLTCGNSENLNDQIEWQKYGPSKKYWKNIFQASFSYGTAEQAFMWYAYGPKNHQSVRLSIPAEAMGKWRETVKGLKGSRLRIMDAKKPDAQGDDKRVVTVDDADIHDILYLAVDDKDRYGRERKNCVAWDAARQHFPTLPDDIRDPDLAGWIKDYEWRAEQETRIRILVKPQRVKVDYVALPIPDTVLSEMSITFGPWATDEEIQAMQAQVKTALADSAVDADKPVKFCKDFFKRSFLFGALKQWEAH